MGYIQIAVFVQGRSIGYPHTISSVNVHVYENKLWK